MYIYVSQTSQNDTLIKCRRKKQLITKHENLNFQPRLWPSSVVVKELVCAIISYPMRGIIIAYVLWSIYIYIYIYIAVFDVDV